MNNGSRVRAFVAGAIAECKKQGHRFSLTFDEWTSTRNRHYMNINVHLRGSKFWNLGLVRVLGSMPAMLKVKLATFGLSLQNFIVSITTDGARGNDEGWSNN